MGSSDFLVRAREVEGILEAVFLWAISKRRKQEGKSKRILEKKNLRNRRQ